MLIRANSLAIVHQPYMNKFRKLTVIEYSVIFCTFPHKFRLNTRISHSLYIQRILLKFQVNVVDFV